MRVGIISGSGAYVWPGLLQASSRTVGTPYGEVPVTTGRIGEIDVVHLSRHGAGHARLSTQVTHKANMSALRSCEVDAVYSLTVCGSVDPALTPGTLIAFDDLYFLSNRLPDGSICTWFDTPEAGRAHWIFESPFSPEVRAAVLAAGTAAGTPVVDGGCYGYVDGPRFNTRTEIAALGGIGVAALSQTAGPEIVLAGEAELPLALLGFVTDHCNGTAPGGHDTPVADLIRLLQASGAIFADLIAATLPVLAAGPAPTPPGVVYRFGS
ncbi:MAG: MTAP family purine nucleoside phosphorylase [Sporichthyaceae bacterium]